MPTVSGRDLMAQREREQQQAVVLQEGTPVTPVEDFVLVLRNAPQERKTKGGLALPDTVESKYEGTVVALGPGKVAGQMYLEAGQRVLFLPHAGIPVMRGSERMLLIRQEAVFGIVGALKAKARLRSAP